MSTTRHILATLVDGGGTVPPELGVVRRLVESGHVVTVLAEDTMRDEVEATGAAFRRWEQAPNRSSRGPDDDPYRDWECRTPMQLFKRLLDTQLVGPAPAYAADVTAALADLAPDLLLTSMFAVGAMVAAEEAELPYWVLHANIWPLPAEGMPPFGVGLKPAAGPIGRLRDRLVGRFLQRTWDRGGLPRLNQLRAERGLPPLAHLFDQVLRADRHLILTSPAFDLPAVLPANATYLGPVLDDPTWVASGWRPPSGDAPLVLVALSSTYQDQISGLQRIIDALGTLPVRGLVTTGPSVDPTSLAPSANVTVVASAPHREVLAEAAALVTHGGHGTVMKALAAGVPMLVLPHGRDQADNAVRITTRGAGLSRGRKATSTTIAADVHRLLSDPSFAAAAADLGAAIRNDALTSLALCEVAGGAQLLERCP